MRQDYTATAELRAMRKNVNHQHKQIVALSDHYSVGDIMDGDEILGLSRPFPVIDIVDMRAEGGEENERVTVQKQYAYFA